MATPRKRCGQPLMRLRQALTFRVCHRHDDAHHAAYSGHGVQGPTGEPRRPAWRCHRCSAPHRPSRLPADRPCALLAEGKPESAVGPARFRTPSTGTCAWERSRLAALPPQGGAGREWPRAGAGVVPCRPRRRIAASPRRNDGVGPLVVTSYRQSRTARSAAASGLRSCCSRSRDWMSR